MVEWAKIVEIREPMATDVIAFIWTGCHYIPNVVLTQMNKMQCTMDMTQTR